VTLRRRQPRPETSADELAFPKSRRSSEEPIDTRDLKFSKMHFDRNAKFRDFVRGHACCMSGFANHECGGVTEFAHLINGGMAAKCSDLYGVPLCSAHHREGRSAFHKLGSVEAFDSVQGTNLWRVCAELLAEWIRRANL